MPKKMRGWLGVRTVLLVGAVFAVSGCGTARSGGAPVVQVSLSADNMFEGGGRRATLADLPALLGKNGAGSATEVVVVVPDHTPAGTMAAISGKLGSAGYRKVMFRKPRRAESHVGPEVRPGK